MTAPTRQTNAGSGRARSARLSSFEETVKPRRRAASRRCSSSCLAAASATRVAAHRARIFRRRYHSVEPALVVCRSTSDPRRRSRISARRSSNHISTRTTAPHRSRVSNPSTTARDHLLTGRLGLRRVPARIRPQSPSLTLSYPCGYNQPRAPHAGVGGIAKMSRGRAPSIIGHAGCRGDAVGPNLAPHRAYALFAVGGQNHAKCAASQGTTCRASTTGARPSSRPPARSAVGPLSGAASGFALRGFSTFSLTRAFTFRHDDRAVDLVGSGSAPMLPP